MCLHHMILFTSYYGELGGIGDMIQEWCITDVNGPVTMVTQWHHHYTTYPWLVLSLLELYSNSLHSSSLNTQYRLVHFFSAFSPGVAVDEDNDKLSYSRAVCVCVCVCMCVCVCAHVCVCARVHVSGMIVQTHRWSVVYTTYSYNTVNSNSFMHPYTRGVQSVHQIVAKHVTHFYSMATCYQTISLVKLTVLTHSISVDTTVQSLKCGRLLY